MASHSELRKLDGISARASWLGDRQLVEFGLIEIKNLGRAGSPLIYLLRQPHEWRVPVTPIPRIVSTEPKLRVETLTGRENTGKEKGNALQALDSVGVEKSS